MYIITYNNIDNNANNDEIWVTYNWKFANKVVKNVKIHKNSQIHRLCLVRQGRCFQEAYNPTLRWGFGILTEYAQQEACWRSLPAAFVLKSA